MQRITTTLILALMAASAGAAESPVKFTTPPSAKAEGDQVRIEFAVDRPTDVAVYVLNAKDEAVRHLAAGVLGDNAPAPLKAGSLAQSLIWDGKDDKGEPAQGGPFKVRVAAGLAPKHAGFPMEQPDQPYVMNGVLHGIAIGAKGNVYTITHRSLIRQRGYYGIQRYTRDGEYAGTVMPFSSQIDPNYAKGISPFADATGRPMMVYNSSQFAILDYMPAVPVVQTPVVRANGNLLMVSVDAFSWERGAQIGLTELRPDGGTPQTPYVRLMLKGPSRFWKGGTPALAFSDDEKQVYLTGLAQYVKNNDTPPFHAVFRVALDGDGKLEPLFGDPIKAGDDDAHLNGPTCLARDGKGRLYVADRGNNRIVVLNEKDGSRVGSFPVDSPHWIGAHRATGAVYVYRHSPAAKPADELVAFSPWPDSKPAHRLTLPSNYYKGGCYVAGLDAEASTPRVWLGQFFNTEAMKTPTPQLLGFYDDLDDGFSKLTPVLGKPGGTVWWSITSDPTHRYILFNDSGARILDDLTGKITRPAKAGGTCTLGPDGLIYAMSSGGNIQRYTMKGAAVPFQAIKPGAWVVEHDEKGRPVIVGPLEKGKQLMGGVSYETCRWSVTDQALPTYPSGTSGNERDFCLDLQGNIYVKNRGADYHGPMKVDVYDKDGAYLRTVMWECGDGDYGPRLDAAGNLYFVMGAVDKDGFLPDPFKSVNWYVRHYASIVKFSPKGGMFMFGDAAAYEKNFGFALPQLGLNKETVTMVKGQKLLPGRVLEGALWRRPGFSVYADLRLGGGSGFCHCNGQSFDTDLFGRTFYPDMLRFQIVVLDTNGNEIIRLGGYGNRDQRGPLSWVRDARSGALRPPGPADEPSPFAEPQFAFAFLNGVAVGEQNLYTTDTLNQRVTRIRMDYAADVTCPVK